MPLQSVATEDQARSGDGGALIGGWDELVPGGGA